MTKDTQSKERELRYEDLKLGEKALEVYRATQRKDYALVEEKYGEEARKEAEKGAEAIRMWNADNLPTFLNRRIVYTTKDGTPLTTTDLVIAQVLGGVNGFLMSDAGSGKSQLIHDIANSYFNGDLRNGGNSIIQTANNDFRLATIMEQRNPDKPAELELTGAHKACFVGIDELTRAHPIVANEFSDLGNGVYHRGKFNERLGKLGYFLTIATGNDPRKKENRGAMDWDGAMLNRFPLALDLASDRFGIAGTEDAILKTKIKPALTGVLYCKPADLTEKIIDAYKQICSMSSDLGAEAEAVFYFLDQGASICPGRNKSEPAMRKKSLLPQWPRACVDCSRAKDSQGKNSLCGLVNTENGRTMPNARRYAAALDYLLKLKAKDAGRTLEYNPSDLAFLAFELCGGLQEGVLNSGVLASQYYASNERMMSQVISGLKEEFTRHGNDLITELDASRAFGDEYSIVKTKDGKTNFVKKLPKDRILNPALGLKIFTPTYDSTGDVPWDFAQRVISQERETQASLKEEKQD